MCQRQLILGVARGRRARCPGDAILLRGEDARALRHDRGSFGGLELFVAELDWPRVLPSRRRAGHLGRSDWLSGSRRPVGNWADARENVAREDIREDLVGACRAGNVTLVLGAGVSYGCGIPQWEVLARRLWEKRFRNQPWPLDPDTEATPTLDLPNFLPFVFEHVAADLTHAGFTDLLKEALYEKVKLPDEGEIGTATRLDTLSVLARKITRNLLPDQHRIVRVITLNVDDMLEIAVEASWKHHDRPGDAPLQVVARPCHHNRQQDEGYSLPVFHVHGYVPFRRGRSQNTAPDALVFTDAQYWGATANPLSFANRVVSNALHDSTCVFVGLSMTDINLLRWLGLRYCELVDDRRSQAEVAHGAPISPEVDEAIARSLTRHFWIRPEDGDGRMAFLSCSLKRRGVRSVPIVGWNSPDFDALMRRCFNRTEG